MNDEISIGINLKLLLLLRIITGMDLVHPDRNCPHYNWNPDLHIRLR